MAHRLGFQTPSIESRKAGMLDALFNAALCRFGIIDVVNYGRVVIHVIDQLALPLAIDDWDYRQTCCQTQCTLGRLSVRSAMQTSASRIHSVILSRMP